MMKEVCKQNNEVLLQRTVSERPEKLSFPTILSAPPDDPIHLNPPVCAKW